MLAGRRKSTALAAVLLVLLVLSSSAPEAQAAPLRDEPLEEGWAPAARRQRVDAPSQAASFLVTTLRIPSIGVDDVVRAGVALEVIDQGPAHWIGTALPGEQGNMVLAGHRTTHTAPFRDLHRLDTGDLVYLGSDNDFEVIYRVTETFVVAPDALWITWDNGEALLTMFACHPLGSAARRIVVRAELVAGRLIA